MAGRRGAGSTACDDGTAGAGWGRRLGGTSRGDFGGGRPDHALVALRHRGIGGGRAHDYNVGVSRAASTRWINDQLLVIPMVEETTAVDNLDAILTDTIGMCEI